MSISRGSLEFTGTLEFILEGSAMLLHLLALLTLLPAQQSIPFSPLKQTSQHARIKELEASMKNGDPSDFANASRELMKIASELNEGEDVIEASRLALNVFLSSAPADARRIAYSIAAQRLPHEAVKHVSVIRMHGPHTTCWGRLKDAFHDRLLSKHPWILSVDVRNTHKKRRADAFGTIAELNFTVGNQRKTKELLEALRSGGFNVSGWTVLVEVPATSLLPE